MSDSKQIKVKTIEFISKLNMNCRSQATEDLDFTQSEDLQTFLQSGKIGGINP